MECKQGHESYDRFIRHQSFKVNLVIFLIFSWPNYSSSGILQVNVFSISSFFFKENYECSTDFYHPPDVWLSRKTEDLASGLQAVEKNQQPNQPTKWTKSPHWGIKHFPLTRSQDRQEKSFFIGLKILVQNVWSVQFWVFLGGHPISRCNLRLIIFCITALNLQVHLALSVSNAVSKQKMPASDISVAKCLIELNTIMCCQIICLSWL